MLRNIKNENSNEIEPILEILAASNIMDDFLFSSAQPISWKSRHLQSSF